ncbi:MAG TPA: APC family permease [Gemmatimonadaceae bacterium]|jgi:amino acid transporter|nr:APC family permease [Gemmatimonadaceae bacterium]
MLKRSLTTLPLVFILYFSTSGGAFTTETLVREVGPGLALLILLLVPLIYSLPEVLIVGELASMLPLEGGYYRWVQRAFGPFWAYQNGWLTWMYSLVDMAIYPVLFNQYLAYFVPSLGRVARWGIALLMIWSATGINLRGALRVGRASIVAGAFIILGFVALAVAALPHIAHTPWQPFAAPGRTGLNGLAVGLSIALWNYIGWDNASTAQGEVRDASRTYPRALAFALPLVALSYFVPLLPALGATDWHTWTEGGWPDIARNAAGSFGPLLAVWIAAAGMVSAIALFNALLLSYSRVPFVVAADGYLPAPLARTDANGTPRNAVIVSALVYSAFVLIPFGSLVVADVLLYSLALSLEFASLVMLRRREPTLRGAFRIPLGANAVTVLAMLPMLVLLLVIFLSFRDGEYGLPALAGTAVAIILGPLTFYFSSREVRKARREGREEGRADDGEPKRASRKVRAEESEPRTSS